MDDLLAKIDFGNEAGDDINPDEITHYFVEQSSFRNYALHKSDD
jgi:hypothetical protein